MIFFSSIDVLNIPLVREQPLLEVISTSKYSTSVLLPSPLVQEPGAVVSSEEYSTVDVILTKTEYGLALRLAKNNSIRKCDVTTGLLQ